MKYDLSYTEAAEILGVHRESVSNYVKRGLLKSSKTNAKAVTLKSVNNLLNNHSDLTDLGKEVAQMKEELLKEKEELAKARQNVKDKLEYNKAKGVTFQNLGYICDALLVYLDAFGGRLNEREKKIVRAVFAHADLSLIGENFGLTKNSIREIFHKSLRRLANSQRAADSIAMNSELQQKIMNQEEIINYLKTSIEYYKKKLHIEEVIQESDYVSIPTSWARSIKEASLSVRSYNCLRAAGVEFVYELAFLSKYDFIRWRNFGIKSLNEVEIFKTSLGMTDNRICDVTEINKIPSFGRTVIPFAVLETSRRKWQKL